jgi:uncharacterized protein (DUF952 family)
MATIYKICTAAEWEAAVRDRVFLGSAVDLRDGYIHFSTGDQVRETAAKYFAGQDGLVLVAFEDSVLGPGLKYEPARGGALFPHLYGPLDPNAALWATPLPLGADGAHAFPDFGS